MGLYYCLDFIGTLTEVLLLYTFNHCFLKQPRFNTPICKWITPTTLFALSWLLTWFSELGAYKTIFLIACIFIVLKLCYKDSIYQMLTAMEIWFMSVCLFSETMGMAVATWIYGDGMIILVEGQKILRWEVYIVIFLIRLTAAFVSYQLVKNIRYKIQLKDCFILTFTFLIGFSIYILVKNSNTAVYWYPVFAVMLGTGLRVGEVTGLRWCDIDLEDGIIDVNHTLVYYDHRTSEGKKGCYFNVNTPKTEAGNRQVPMLDFVKEAFVMEKERQELLGVHCEATIDGYTDFIFLNRFGQPQHQSTLNKAIRRIIRDCNDEQFLKTENPEVLLPHFSCHSLRHTFTTRMCEAGVNIKVIQDALGHTDISTTLNIYTDVTKELKTSESKGLDNYFKAQ